MKNVYLSTLLLGALTFNGCGSGGGGNSETEEGKNIPPKARIIGSNRQVEINKPVTIEGEATDADGTIVSYEWKKDNETLGTEKTLVYIPTVKGRDIIKFFATDDDGAIGEGQIALYVKDKKESTDSNTENLILEEKETNKDFPNEKENAKEIPINSTIRGKLDLTNDIDYLKFTLNSKKIIEFSGGSKIPVFIGFRVYNSEKKQLLSDLMGEGMGSTYKLELDAGTYFIQLTVNPLDELTSYEFTVKEGKR